MLNLISHIRNEELLLPHWIAHHRPMFDSVTIIDYASTDSSLDIIRTLAPEWRILRSQNVNFDANNADFEVMQIEYYLSGWKIALNTTEYVVCSNLCQLIINAENAGFHGIIGEASFILHDKLRLGFSKIKNEPPILEQLNYGWQEDPSKSYRRRLLHRWPTGSYSVGRHSWMRGPTANSSDLLYASMAYAPWDGAMINRKIAIGSQVSEHDRKIGLGNHHHLSAIELEDTFNKSIAEAVDLHQNNYWHRIVLRK
jgi:hypothetical protein